MNFDLWDKNTGVVLVNQKRELRIEVRRVAHYYVVKDLNNNNNIVV